MVEITSQQRGHSSQQQPFPQNNYDLSEDMDQDTDAPRYQQSEVSESDRENVPREAAKEKMKKLAQKIYDTTPGINDQFPKKTSKILGEIKHDEVDGARIAHNFMQKCDQIADLRKQRKDLMNKKNAVHGSITDKDLTLEVAAQDWPYLYEKNYQIYLEECVKSKELEQTKITKQENYIYREQEYRQVIQDLKTKIDTISQKPLERVRNKSEDQIQMENINIKLKQNDPNSVQPDDLGDNDPNANLAYHERKPNERQVTELWNHLDSIDKEIKVLRDRTQLGLQSHKNELWRKLDNHYSAYRQDLMADSLKKKQNDEDPLVREQSLNDQLELMTHMAQQLDKEHEKLKDLEQKLKIDYSSQENDADLLLKQIIYYKTQQKQIKSEHQRIKEELDQAQKEEEETDRKLASKLDKKGADSNHLHMPTIMKGKKKQEATQGTNSMFRMLNSSSKGFGQGTSVPPSVTQKQGAPRLGTAPNNAFGRPKTAGLMGDAFGAGVAQGNRPQTGAIGQPNGLPVKNSLKRFAPAGATRAASAGFSQNQKLQRCEVLITRFKKKLEEERRLLRMMKTMSAQEIETKNMLEKILRQCVDDVKAEIAKKRSENKSSYYARGKRGKIELKEEQNLTAQEREKIIEVLMSQERVLTLLYDKTFPPRSQSVGFTGQLGTQFNTGAQRGTGGNLGTQSAHKLGLSSVDSMNQFNYLGNNPVDGLGVDPEDLEALERDTVSAMMRRGTETAVGGKRERLDQNIVNMTTTNFQGRTMTAGENKRRRHIPKYGSMSTSKGGAKEVGGLTGMTINKAAVNSGAGFDKPPRKVGSYPSKTFGK